MPLSLVVAHLDPSWLSDKQLSLPECAGMMLTLIDLRVLLPLTLLLLLLWLKGFAELDESEVSKGGNCGLLVWSDSPTDI